MLFEALAEIVGVRISSLRCNVFHIPIPRYKQLLCPVHPAQSHIFGHRQAAFSFEYTA